MTVGVHPVCFVCWEEIMKKGQIYEGIIERVDFPNKGMIYIPEEEKYVTEKDTTVTVKNGIPGQKVRFMINKKRGGRVEGRLLEVLEKSPLETREPVCSIFPACGGCMYQTMSYEEQVKMKEGQIHRIMDPVVKGDYIFESVKESPKEFHYRNKMEFSFGDEYKDGPLSLGLHKKGSTYDVLTAADCQLVHRDMNQILSCVLAYFRKWNVSYYKKMQHTGYLRHLLLRRGDTTGEILVNLHTSFPAERIVDIDNFRSLLYYYGLLTICGTRGDRLRMCIPNHCVREQYFGFLRDYYQQIHPLNLSHLKDQIDDLVYDGHWKPFFESIAGAYHENSSIRDGMEGERNLQGFLKAYLALASYYLVEPELEMNYGYCDFFLLPDKQRYPDIEHSYILELKYAARTATDAELAAQAEEGRRQLHQYSEDKIARQLAKGTTLHRLLLQFRGWEMLRCEEI